jgi:hypothetical protein
MSDDEEDFKLPDTASLIIMIVMNLLMQVRFSAVWDVGTIAHNDSHSYHFSLLFHQRTSMQNTWEEMPLSLALSSVSRPYLLDLL